MKHYFFIVLLLLQYQFAAAQKQHLVGVWKEINLVSASDHLYEKMKALPARDSIITEEKFMLFLQARYLDDSVNLILPRSEEANDTQKKTEDIFTFLVNGQFTHQKQNAGNTQKGTYTITKKINGPEYDLVLRYTFPAPAERLFTLQFGEKNRVVLLQDNLGMFSTRLLKISP